MPKLPKSYAALRKYAEGLEPKARAAFLRTIADQQDDVNLRALAKALELGDREAAAEAVRLGNLVKRLPQLRRVTDAAFEAGGRLAAAEIGFRFNVEHPTMVEAARKNAARLVVEVSEQARAAVRGVIVRSLREGLAPDQAARLIRGLVGLTERQANAVLNYRAELSQQERPAAQAERMAQRYAAKLLARRSETIARTEIINAATQGTLASWRDAQAEGLVPPGAEARKVWIVTDDDRLCPRCLELDGQVVGIHERFVAADGTEVEGPALHPNCRCTIGMEFAEA